MSKKFDKNRSVDYRYLACPLKYTNIFHPNNHNKELVLLDQLGKSYTAAWRNDKTNKIGITFLLKIDKVNGKNGFWFKDKFYSHNRSGWVW